MRMRLEKMRERAKAFQSSNNAAQSSSSFGGQNYSVWKEDNVEMRNDDRHSMGEMLGQQGGYGGRSSRFAQQEQDDPMTYSPFGGQEKI